MSSKKPLIQRFFTAQSVSCSPALNTVNVSRAVRRPAGTLAFPYHLAKTVHCFVVRIMQRITFGCQQFNRLPNAARLVDGALFADGQVH